MPEIIEPTPGDPSTEPVATAQQSHVDGRVGPPTIAQDANAEAYAPAGVEQIEPGEVVSAATPFDGGPLPKETEEGDYAGPAPTPAGKASPKPAPPKD